MKLEGLVALVTGGSSGLGEASVIALVEAGCKVMIGDMNEEGAKALIAKFGKDKVAFVKTDVSDEQACNDLVEQTVKTFGAVHIVLNSAGIAVRTSILTATQEDITKILKINVIGTFNVSKAAAYQMSKQKPISEKDERGVIINVASIMGIEATPDLVGYAMSKGAIIGMTLPLARDLGKFGIRVVTLAPGLFLTPMGKSYPEKFLKVVKRVTPLNRIGAPEEFADAVISVAKNSFLTGEVIRLDGGLRIGHA